MKILMKLSQGIDVVNRTIGRTFAWILIPIIILTSFEVFSRYVLNSPTVWAWELIVQLWAFMLMVCGGYCYWKGGFVRVDVFYSKLPEKAKYVVGLITAVLAMTCMVLIFKYGWNMAYASLLRNERISSVWGSPMWTIRMWVPLGAGLMLLQAISEFIKNVGGLTGKVQLVAQTDEVAEAIEQVKATERLPYQDAAQHKETEEDDK